jgi:flagellar hook-basal body complex protein FliE
MPFKKKHLTRKRKNAKIKTKAKAKGKGDIVPFLLKQKLGNLTNKQKQATLKNIFSNLPRQSVEDAIIQKELALKELAEKPRQLDQITPVPIYNYPFQQKLPRGYEYNYPLVKVMGSNTETDLVDNIYSLKRDAEYPKQFLQTLFANFLKITKKRRNNDYILSRIPDYELQQVLTTRKFFIIDFDFLSNALELTGQKLTTRGSYSGTSNYTKGITSVNASKTKKFKSYNAFITKKIKNIIFDPLINAYKAYWAIKHTTKIMINYYSTLSGRQPDPRPYPNIRHFPIEHDEPNLRGELQRFRDVWHHTEVGKQKYKNELWDFAHDNYYQEEPEDEPLNIPEVTNVHVYDVLTYYILELNRMLEYLATYRISVVRELLDAINNDLAYIINKIHTLYGRGLIRPVAPQNTEQDYHRPDFIITIPDLP